MKIVINTGMGFFDLSARALQMFCEKKKIPCYFFEADYESDGVTGKRIDAIDCKDYEWDAFKVEDPNEYVRSAGLDSEDVRSLIEARINTDEIRTDPDFIAIVEECQRLKINVGTEINVAKIVEIPDGIEWEIQCDDETCSEWVSEKHRTWR